MGLGGKIVLSKNQNYKASSALVEQSVISVLGFKCSKRTIFLDVSEFSKSFLGLLVTLASMATVSEFRRRIFSF